jgi:hypothetical protein
MDMEISSELELELTGETDNEAILEGELLFF